MTGSDTDSSCVWHLLTLALDVAKRPFTILSCCFIFCENISSAVNCEPACTVSNVQAVCCLLSDSVPSLNTWPRAAAAAVAISAQCTVLHGMSGLRGVMHHWFNFWFRCYIYFTAFRALTLLVGRQEGHPDCLNGCWHGYLSGARCRLAYGPAAATATHCLLLQ